MALDEPRGTDRMRVSAAESGGGGVPTCGATQRDGWGWDWAMVQVPGALLGACTSCQ